MMGDFPSTDCVQECGGLPLHVRGHLPGPAGVQRDVRPHPLRDSQGEVPRCRSVYRKGEGGGCRFGNNDAIMILSE